MSKKTFSLIQVELTEDEQISLLGLIVNSTNRIIAEGDPNNWLEDLESVEEKIRAARAEQEDESVRMPIIYDYRGA